MNKKLLFYFIYLISISSFGQQIYVGVGSTISSFDYLNSRGEPLNNLQPKTKGYFDIGYRAAFNPTGNRKFQFRVGAFYSGYGAVGNLVEPEVFFEYNVNFLGPKAGLDFLILDVARFKLVAEVSLAGEFMVEGTQILNNELYNLQGEEEFRNFNFFARGGFSLMYPLSRNTAIFAAYNYGSSFPGKTGSDGEKLNIRTNHIGIGFVMNLDTCGYCDF